MPTDPSSFSARSGSQPPTDPAPAGRYGNDASGIRRQASEIIQAVLSDPAPEQARARDMLRGHVAAHPGHPEIALAEHLSSLRSLTESPAGAPGALPPTAPADGRHPGETPATAAAESISRIEAVLNGRMLLTAFQPIFDLSTGAVVGVEAFTRFVSDGNDAAGWFAEAAEARLGSELRTLGHSSFSILYGFQLGACNVVRGFGGDRGGLRFGQRSLRAFDRSGKRGTIDAVKCLEFTLD